MRGVLPACLERGKGNLGAQMGIPCARVTGRVAALTLPGHVEASQVQCAANLRVAGSPSSVLQANGSASFKVNVAGYKASAKAIILEYFEAGTLGGGGVPLGEGQCDPRSLRTLAGQGTGICWRQGAPGLRLYAPDWIHAPA